LETAQKSRWAVLLVVVMSVFMATLDSSIVNVALPIMSKELNVTTGEIAWVVSAYLIAISSTILFFGRLGDLIGKTNVFKLGLAVFTVGSFLCGLTHSFTFLIVARVVQAVGAACTMANSQGIITHVFPPKERGRALGISGTFVALGTLAGPALGGLIVAYTKWEYIFWINIPIGIAVFILGMFKLPKREQKLKEKLDIPGAVLFILTVAPLFFALEQGQAIGYDHGIILAGFIVAVASLIAFLLIERRQEHPLLDLTLFKNTWFSVSILCGFISFVAMFCATLVQPFYLQNVLKMTPETAGLYMSIYPLVLAVVAPLSGYLSDKIGSEILTLIGLTVTSIGLVLMSTLNEFPALAWMAVYIGVMSIGNGLFQSPNNSLVMSTVPREKLGIGGSVNALIRNVGMVCGIALSTTILYGGMSEKIGCRVTGYIEGQNDAFIFGMRNAYIMAAAICAVGVIVTAVRLFKRKKIKTAK
jgi:EmrB/QacA subfamily drug resistance transporter